MVEKEHWLHAPFGKGGKKLSRGDSSFKSMAADSHARWKTWRKSSGLCMDSEQRDCRVPLLQLQQDLPALIDYTPVVLFSLAK